MRTATSRNEVDGVPVELMYNNRNVALDSAQQDTPEPNKGLLSPLDLEFTHHRGTTVGRAQSKDTMLAFYFEDEAFSSRIYAFTWFDVIISAVVVLLFVVVEGRRLGVRHLWAPFIAMFRVGVSLALPLFLFLRQFRLEELRWPKASLMNCQEPKQ